MKKRIYYFTGTGNSMRAARVIANKLGDVEIVSMRMNPMNVSATDCDVIGFIYPVYHWTMPAPAVEFVERLEINPEAYIFAIAMPSFVCGIACEKLEEILNKKGAHICYGNLVNSVANYAIVYPPFPPAKLVVPRTERKLKKLAEAISKNEARPYPRASAFVRKKRNSKMGPYLELQKYADNPFTVSDECISCGLCSRVCPCNNLAIENGRPVFMHHCANCMACVVNCPKRAIGYEITSQDSKLLETSNTKTPLVKIMGLPKRRKLYRNPYITSSDLTKEREQWPKEEKQKM